MTDLLHLNWMANCKYNDILMAHSKDLIQVGRNEFLTLEQLIISIMRIHHAYTHYGTHHADDVTSTAFFVELHSLLYRLFYHEYSYKEFVTRITYVSPYIKKEETDGHAIVYDVGFGKFDHHDKHNIKLRPPRIIKNKENVEIPYASLGLLWKYYGRLYLILSYLVRYDEYPNDRIVEKFFNRFDTNVILPIDARDNGIFDLTDSNYSETIANFNAMRSYSVSEFTFNKPLTGIFKNISSDFAFNYACDFADRAFSGWICNALKDMKDAQFVEKQLENHDPTNSVLVLNRYVKLDDATLESHPEIHYCVYPSSRNKGCWCAQSIQKNKVPFYPFSTNRFVYGKRITYVNANGSLLNALSLEDAVHACQRNDLMLNQGESSISTTFSPCLYLPERKEVS